MRQFKQARQGTRHSLHWGLDKVTHKEAQGPWGKGHQLLGIWVLLALELMRPLV